MYKCFACLYVCVPYLYQYLQRPEDGIRDPLKLELRMVRSPHVGTGN